MKELREVNQKYLASERALVEMEQRYGGMCVKRVGWGLPLLKYFSVKPLGVAYGSPAMWASGEISKQMLQQGMLQRKKCPPPIYPSQT